jgi:hypothetical protein
VNVYFFFLGSSSCFLVEEGFSSFALGVSAGLLLLVSAGLLLSAGLLISAGFDCSSFALISIGC